MIRIQRQSGFTLIEILVALFVGLFLLGGLFTILQTTRRTSSNQTGLTQLQDEERMAMSMINDVVQNAGYFDTNTYQTAKTAWPAAVADGVTGVPLAAGQAVSGLHPGGTASDMLVARYATNGTASVNSDGIISCAGTTSTTPAIYLNTFFVLSIPAAPGVQATSGLYCTPDGTQASQVLLVTGVQNLLVWYGVATLGLNNNVDTYKTADQMLPTDWLNTTSVRVTLTFLNPLYAAAQSTQQPQYVYFTRVIALQGRTGVTATAL